MALNVSTGLVPEWYTLAGQGEAPARVQLRPLKGWEKLDLRNNYNMESRTISGAGILQSLQRCIVAWENVIDSDGKPIPCTPENVSELDMGAMLELIAKVQEISFLSEAARKN